MKAAPEAQKRLLELAQLDSVLDRLAHRRRTLPVLAEVDKLATQRARLSTAAIAVATEASDLTREQNKAEGDVDAVRARAERDQQRLDSGQVSSARDLSGLQSEITSLRRRQGDLEEVVLEIMERRETAEAEVARLNTESEEVTAKLTEAERLRDAAVTEIDEEHTEVAGKRASLSGDIPDDLLALYEKLRGQYTIGAAMLHGGRCQGCKVTLSIADINRIKAAAPDEVIRCEECRRILVRTPESGL